MPSLPNDVTVMDKRKDRKGKKREREGGRHIHREKILEIKRKQNKYWALGSPKDPDIRRSLYLV